MALTTGAALGAAGLGGLSSVANGSSGWSNSSGKTVSDSWGSSGSYNYANSDSWSDSLGWSLGEEGSSSWGNNYGQTFGREASALDIENAAKANQLNFDLWKMQADYNAQQAQIDRDFQERMSNTAYQRAVQDLLRAGLNPILAVGNIGASTPVGAMANSGLQSATKANAIAESYNYGSSGSQAYGRNASKTTSKSESHSRSEGSSGSSEGSHSESSNTSNSRTTNNLLKGIEKIGSYISNKTSAKDAGVGTARNGVTNWRGYTK